MTHLGRMASDRIGWLQVFLHPAHASGGSANFAVDDLDTWGQEIQSRGVTPGAVQAVDKGVRSCAVSDPDGNTVTTNDSAWANASAA